MEHINCHICNKTMRQDVLVRHCKSLHADVFIKSMSTDFRNKMITERLPIAVLTNGKDVLCKLCLHCGKGWHNRISRKVDLTGLHTGDENPCRKAFDTYRSRYTDEPAVIPTLFQSIARSPDSLKKEKNAVAEKVEEEEATLAAATLIEVQKASGFTISDKLMEALKEAACYEPEDGPVVLEELIQATVDNLRRVQAKVRKLNTENMELKARLAKPESEEDC